MNSCGRGASLLAPLSSSAAAAAVVAVLISISREPQLQWRGDPFCSSSSSSSFCCWSRRAVREGIEDELPLLALLLRRLSSGSRQPPGGWVSSRPPRTIFPPRLRKLMPLPAQEFFDLSVLYALGDDTSQGPSPEVLKRGR